MLQVYIAEWKDGKAFSADGRGLPSSVVFLRVLCGEALANSRRFLGANQVRNRTGSRHSLESAKTGKLRKSLL